MLQLTTATAADLPALSQLVNLAYRPGEGQAGWTHESALIRGARTSEAQLAAVLAAPGQVLLGWQAGQLVACVHIEPADSYGYIGMLAVDPACQAGGIGKAMLAHAEATLASHYRLLRARMSVLAGRPELRAYYLRRGYQPTGERQPYPLGAGVGLPLDAALDLEMLEKPLVA
ncbi:GNAT family N-acetyltransferase [Vogesella sp. XCS3]|uniref:GNAT family N-acetyltransferase n=1 Tax=Vogesella sp. XCS3 TaxID=2877939 RepID=UPI001D09E611|nr:N-acetyltransferase [Vogesella sp. XCS3]UDM17161.1 GNAT family N-acetyltransferase [Vogesella sp. XCS3]